MAKKRDKVAEETLNPPQIHTTTLGPTYGIVETRLVITVAPQYLICPHGSTYPTKATNILMI